VVTDSYRDPDPAPVDTQPWVVTGPRYQLGFWGLLMRLLTGASSVDIDVPDHQVPDTTVRARCDAWIDGRVFDALRTEALAAFDRVIGLDLDDVALGASLHKHPRGGGRKA
jgi:hypothetical protein